MVDGAYLKPDTSAANPNHYFRAWTDALILLSFSVHHAEKDFSALYAGSQEDT